jgi:Xaa-Pro aminopeptidase
MEPVPTTTEVAVATEVATRRELLSQALAKQQVDAILIASESNFTYLTGYTTGSWANKTFPLFLVFLPGRRPWAIVGAGEVDSISVDGGDVEIVPYSHPRTVTGLARAELDFIPHAADEIAALLRGAGVRRLAIEKSLPYGPRLAQGMLAEVADRAKPVELLDVSPLMSEMRRRKSPLEIGAMQASADVLARAYELFEERIEAGMTERELRRAFVAAGSDAGSDRVGYVGVIADARRASLGGPSDRAWEPGQLLMFDACIEVGGYWADFCRIYANEEPTREQLAAYDELVRVLTETRDDVATGMPIAAIARRLSDAGDGPLSLYGRSGHGIGLDYTEPPSLHVDEVARAEPGMVLCLEPNRCIEGVGNLTAEEEVVITETGARLLSPPFPTELRVLG